MQGLAPTRRTLRKREGDGVRERVGGGAHTETQTHLTGLQECSKDQQCQARAGASGNKMTVPSHTSTLSLPLFPLTLSHSCAACCSFRRQLNSHLFCSLPPFSSKEPNTLLPPSVSAPRLVFLFICPQPRDAHCRKSRLPTRIVICVIYTYGKDLQNWQHGSVCKVAIVYDFIVPYAFHICKAWQLCTYSIWNMLI